MCTWASRACGSCGCALAKPSSLSAASLKKLFAQDQVARFGGLVDQGAAFLVVEQVLDRGRQRGVGSEQS